MNKVLRLLGLMVFLLLNINIAFSQSAYQPLGGNAYQMIDRIEIKSGRFLNSVYTSSKPYQRQDIINSINDLDTMRFKTVWNKVDSANLTWLRVDNSEFANSKIARSKKPILRYFYISKANFLSYNDGDLVIKVDPVLDLGLGKEQGSLTAAKYINARGVEMRGSISKRLGFYFYATENQLAPPDYVTQYVNTYGAVPGAGYFKLFKSHGYDYFNARGYIDFKVFKYITVTFGVDRNFIGNGERSLFLSDFSEDYLYLKLSTKIWKFQYDNIFMQGIESYTQTAPDSLLPKRYGAFHHLSINLTKWLNIGAFEGIVFHRTNGIELDYLNPIIFYRSAEQYNGSPDNAVLGIDGKINLVKHVQLYGQLLIDDLNIGNTETYGLKYWGNKYGVQAGAKYIDAFMIPNLDLQAETNWVRPYTYAHLDPVSSYTNYDQPLAHPLGANFKELIGILRYQPISTFFITGKAFYIISGDPLDAGNYGSDIERATITPQLPSLTSYIGQGTELRTMLATLNLSYEVRHNLFIDLDFVYRKVTEVATGYAAPSTKYGMLSLRWNMPRKEYNF